MKNSFKKALKIYKYLAVFFSIIYWVYIVIDDYGFIERYWPNNLLEYLGLWMVYFLMYFIGFSFYYWVAAIVVVLIYHKIIKQGQQKSDSV
jgi:hypothetical protein